jgi:hypothetical protein
MKIDIVGGASQSNVDKKIKKLPTNCRRNPNKKQARNSRMRDDCRSKNAEFNKYAVENIFCIGDEAI